MTNKYLDKIASSTFAVGAAKSLRQSWKDAEPLSRIGLGLGAVGTSMGALNLVNSTSNTASNKKRNELEQKSLQTLSAIRKDLARPPVIKITAPALRELKK